ncbi:hypothetical protein TcCL_NonESM12975 [Trypanosoma cruzi]|nr:hypothetical protein TcCL_NonESM12975 [Trypanosoma cruzi]
MTSACGLLCEREMVGEVFNAPRGQEQRGLHCCKQRDARSCCWCCCGALNGLQGICFRRLIIFLIGASRGLLRRGVGWTEGASVVWRCCELVPPTFVHIFPFLSASLPRRRTGSVWLITVSLAECFGRTLNGVAE